MEKEILDSYNTETQFKRLIDNITYYSDYSLFNTLLVDYQYPNFLDLGTRQRFVRNGFNVLDNAKAIKILSPNNDIYVKVNNGKKEEIKLLDDLTRNELKKFNDPDDNSIVLDHKEFKGLDVLELFDCKDTDMTREHYKSLELPVLFTSSYDEIYNSFIKTMYSSGYKIKYVDNLNSKFYLDKDTKTVNIKNGLSNQIKILSLIDVYTSQASSNDFEKELLKHVIFKGIGIDDNFEDRYSLLDWYKKTDIKVVDKTLKLLSSKGRKFINKFNKFYDMEIKYYPNENIDLYEDYNFKI